MKSYKLQLFSFLIILAGAVSVSAQGKYVGLKYVSDSLPAELNSIGGFVAAADDEGLMDSLFGVNYLRPASSDSIEPTMLWFEKTIEVQDDDGSQVRIEVLDVLQLPLITDVQTVVANCFINGKSDPQIFAIAKADDEKEFYTRFVKVWRANVSTGKFEVIPSKGVKCENIGYGV